ncbi:MAG: OB-fold domain-containing protein [Pseudodonghicola sp.]
MTSILAIGTHLPRLRLARTAMAGALGWLTAGAGAGKGTRTLAFWDEDPLTMAVAAARRALAGRDRAEVTALHFASTTAPFAEPQTAALMRAALRLPADCRAQDSSGTPRAALLALQAALEGGKPTLIAAGEMPQTLAGSLAESRAGDAGAAVLTGQGPGLLQYLGGASLSAPFTDRYAAQGLAHPQDWEERWVREEGYLGLMPDVIARALDAAGLTPADVGHFVLPCPIPGVAAALASRAGLSAARLAPTLAEVCGDTGAAHALLLLGHTLESVAPGDVVLLAQFGQGGTALVFRAEPAIAQLAAPVSPQIAQGVEEQNYMKLLAFRGRIDWDRGLRGRFFVNEALSTAWRYSDALLGFVGGRCRDTGRVQFPPTRLTAGDGFHLDTQEPWPLADTGGTVATFTADLLAFSPHPPNCYGLVDFNGGGRLLMEFTDPGAAEIAPGAPVEFVFRIKDLDPQTGYRRYFWKAVAAPAGR